MTRVRFKIRAERSWDRLAAGLGFQGRHDRAECQSPEGAHGSARSGRAGGRHRGCCQSFRSVEDGREEEARQVAGNRKPRRPGRQRAVLSSRAGAHACQGPPVSLWPAVRSSNRPGLQRSSSRVWFRWPTVPGTATSSTPKEKAHELIRSRDVCPTLSPHGARQLNGVRRFQAQAGTGDLHRRLRVYGQHLQLPGGGHLHFRFPGRHGRWRRQRGRRRRRPRQLCASKRRDLPLRHPE
jgi:hypothetical protein